MSDLRVLVFFYMVEGALVGFCGMALLGIRLNRRLIILVGILQGLVVYFVRGIYIINNIPFGTHTFLSMAGLILVLKLVTRKGWGICSAASLLGFIIVLLSEGLMLPAIFSYMAMTFEKGVGDVWLHVAMGYCGDWLLLLVAIYLGLTKKALIKVESLDSKA